VRERGGSNSMTPIMPLTLGCAGMCIYAATRFAANDYICWMFSISAVLFMVTAFVIAIYFAFRDPDQFRTDDYRLRDSALRITASKGGLAKLAPIELKDIANPYVARSSVSSEHLTAATTDQEEDRENISNG